MCVLCVSCVCRFRNQSLGISLRLSFFFLPVGLCAQAWNMKIEPSGACRNSQRVSALVYSPSDDTLTQIHVHIYIHIHARLHTYICIRNIYICIYHTHMCMHVHIYIHITTIENTFYREHYLTFLMSSIMPEKSRPMVFLS